jgi:hypothetical protein
MMPYYNDNEKIEQTWHQYICSCCLPSWWHVKGHIEEWWWQEVDNEEHFTKGQLK